MRQSSILRMLWTSLLVILLLLPTFASPSVTYACVWSITPPETRFKNADVVFVGTALTTTSPPSRWYQLLYDASTLLPFETLADPNHYYVRFEVHQAWRGEAYSQIVVETDEYCGISFEAGKDYIVYADQILGGGLDAGFCCLGTREISYASNDLVYLNTLPTLPLTPPPLDLARLLCLTLPILMLIAVFAFIWRRKVNYVQKAPPR